jgi:hypothetical protein
MTQFSFFPLDEVEPEPPSHHVLPVSDSFFATKIKQMNNASLM